MLKRHPFRTSLLALGLGISLVACDAVEKFFVQDLGFEVVEIDSGKYFAPKLEKATLPVVKTGETSPIFDEMVRTFQYCGGYEVTQAEPVGPHDCVLKVGDDFRYSPKQQNVSDYPFDCAGCPDGASNVKIETAPDGKLGAHTCTISIKRKGEANQCGFQKEDPKGIFIQQ